MKIIKVDNPFEKTLNDLNLFQQTTYCYKYLKNNNPSMDDELINKHALIASACFRQANEYINSAKLVKITTSPLLYSYALNNLLKGVCYLISFDDTIINGFKSHGFKLKQERINKSILTTKVSINIKGALISLLNIYNNSIITQDVSIDTLLKHIPGIEDIYYRTTGNVSYVASHSKSDNNEFIIYGSNISSTEQEIFNEIGLMCTGTNTDELSCSFSTAGQIKQDNKTYSKDNLFYKNYLIIPSLFDSQVIDINVSFYCYLLIMSYGMLVRYNAHRWEEFIDKRASNEATLLELSIDKAVKVFYYQMHYLLFNYYYEESSFDDLNIKRVINDSTQEIMQNINKELKRKNIQKGVNQDLPW